jgi:hypothetical protein
MQDAGMLGGARAEQLAYEVKLIQDEQGQLWQEFDIKPRFRLNSSSLPCNDVCGHPEMKRPHLTCISCRFRRIIEGKMPNRIRVDPYWLFIWLDRPQSRVKGELLKRVLTLAEFLAS